MTEFYIRHMVMSHNDGRWDDRRNYASMAGIDFVRYFYFAKGLS